MLLSFVFQEDVFSQELLFVDFSLLARVKSVVNSLGCFVDFWDVCHAEFFLQFDLSL
jgi:hypothetical protein